MQKYKGLVVGLICVLSVLPLAASADTNAELQIKIESLRAQIKVLEDSARALQASRGEDRNENENEDMKKMGTSTSYMKKGDTNRSLCAPIARNLGLGSRGDDVKELQKMLAMDPILFNASSTGFFGKETAKAMMRFQIRNGIATSTRGLVGPRTREFFKRQCASPRALEVRHEGRDWNATTSATSTATSTWPMHPRSDR